MVLADSTVAPWDIKDTRSPEEIEAAAAAKQRPSLKTLRRIRAKEMSGKTVPAGTILIKDWPSLPKGELEIQPYVIPKQPEEEDEKDENPESQEIEGDADSGSVPWPNPLVRFFAGIVGILSKRIRRGTIGKRSGQR